MKQSDFKAGQKWRVVKDGAGLRGMQPCGPGAQQGWSRSLEIGTILTCAGSKWTFGDGVPIIKWLDENGQHLANDCEFAPSRGGIWASTPCAEYLFPVSDDVDDWYTVNGALDHTTTFEASVRAAWCDEGFEAQCDRLIERASEQEGEWIVWNPEDNENGFLLIGNDPFDLAAKACDHYAAALPWREAKKEA